MTNLTSSQYDRFPKFLTGNALKILAAIFMTIDHIGVMLFPRVLILRIIGRLAMPIYAFMIAEGCKYTRNKKKYFGMVFGLGAVCQLVYYFASGDTYLNILLTFSLSIGLIYSLQAMHQAKSRQRAVLWSVLFCAGFLAVYGLNQILTIDYGFWGVMAPVFVSFAFVRKFPHWTSVLLLGFGLILLAADLGGMQSYSLLAIPLLLLYSGKRGKANLKYFFYIFYPVHLAVLQGIAWLVR